jgi:tetratricopeptide (TPR) repeat protein
MTAANLANGIAAARAGRLDEARASLLKALEADDRNESAWLWLSGVIGSPDERRICLENVLAINPDNTHARRGLELIESQQPAAAPQAAPAAVIATTTLIEAPPASPPALWLPPAQPETPPAAVRPATGETIVLRPEAVEAAIAAPPPSPEPAPASEPPADDQALGVPPIVTEDLFAEEPCPYCGATTQVRDRSCPACRKSLMVRRPPRDKRSVALTVLVGLWALSSLSALGGGVMIIIPVVALAMQAQSFGYEMPVAPLVGLILAVLISVALCVMTTIGLYQRKRWAYIAHWSSVALGVAMTALWVVLVGVVGASALSAIPALDSETAADLAAAGGSLGAALLCSVVIYGLYIALTVLSHRDFYGEMARMSTAGVSTGEEPFNAGIQYRDRGMWYMAAHAWERAALQSPRDTTVRRALGLAYAQLRRYDQARVALQEALALAPGDIQLADDLALVERLAAGKR